MIGHREIDLTEFFDMPNTKLVKQFEFEVKEMKLSSNKTINLAFIFRPETKSAWHVAPQEG